MPVFSQIALLTCLSRYLRFTCLALIILLAIAANLAVAQIHAPDEYACTYQAGNIEYNWTLACSPILIASDIGIPSDQTLFIEAGVEVFYNEGVTLRVLSEIEVQDGDYVVFASAGEWFWDGIEINSQAIFEISNLHISGANSALSIVSSGGVSVTGNVLEFNQTAVRLTSDDGVRSRINPVTNNLIRDNGVGISATSTGADIQNNHLDSNDRAVSLSGNICGAGSPCGWSTVINSNLITDSQTGIYSRGHRLTILNNDILNNDVGMAINNLDYIYYTIADNNIGGWQGVAVVNDGVNELDLGGLWVAEPVDEQTFCDRYDHISRGKIIYQPAPEMYAASHGYVRPELLPSGVIESPCVSDGYTYVDTDLLWDGDQTIASSMYTENGTTLTVTGGSVISVVPGVEIIIAGRLTVNGDSAARFQSTNELEYWTGLKFQRADDQTLSNLHISGANSALSIVSSGGVSIAGNVLERNLTAVRLNSDDGVRSRVNPVTNNVIRDNGVGVSATSTGADIQNNYLVGNNRAIQLSGLSCTGGGDCGYRTYATGNLLVGNNESMLLRAHSVEISDNDLTCNIQGITLNQYGGSQAMFTGNNFGSVEIFHFRLESSFDVDLGSSWFYSTSEIGLRIYDFDDDSGLGEVTYQLSELPFQGELNQLDYDGDGLDDYRELLQNSCPDRADTDGDSYSDKEEFDAGTDPRNPKSNPEVIFMSGFEG